MKRCNFTENCGQIFCCDSSAKDDYNISTYEISTYPKLDKVCQGTFKNPLIGSFEGQDLEEVSTLIILKEDEIYQNYDYFGCVNFDIIKEGIEENDEILAATWDGNAFSVLNNDVENLKIRIWDFTSDCHSELVPNEISPIGAYDLSYAIFCKKGFDCTEKIAQSAFDPDLLLNVDYAFKQDKCISNSDILEEILNDDWDLSEDFGGNFSCVEACKR